MTSICKTSKASKTSKTCPRVADFPPLENEVYVDYRRKLHAEKYQQAAYIYGTMYRPETNPDAWKGPSGTFVSVPTPGPDGHLIMFDAT